MKVALAQIDYHVGNFEYNSGKIVQCIKQAQKENTDLIVFAELAICGYPPRDFLDLKDFISLCENSMDLIAKQCVGITAIVGGPSRNKNTRGKNLFNSAWILEDGVIREKIHKCLLPNYDVFDEYRYFESNDELHCVLVQGKKIALTVCEDLWFEDPDPLYRICPMDTLIKENPDFAINIAASPFSYNHPQKRYEILVKNAKKYKIPFLYVNHVGAQTELIFDGGSMWVTPDEKRSNVTYFQEEIFYTNLESLTSEINPFPGKFELIYRALVLGVKDYFKKLGFNKAVLGLSGGIDSAVVYTIAVKALGKENVLAVLLPSPYSSKGSVDDAMDMVNRVGGMHETIPIQEVFNSFLSTLKAPFQGKKADLAEENIQARIRGTLLMALANKHGYILLNTSNKSELAVGYSTLYGDSNGGISVIGDLYKTEVYELASYINKLEGNIIPEAILTKAPSAELREGQKDSDSLPEYDVLDRILFQYVEEEKSPSEIVNSGFDKNLVLNILRLVNNSEWKRAQMPPILRVSDKAFGMGRRMPIEGKFLS